MSTYTAIVRWSGDDPEGYRKGRYYRGHEWAFDGGTVVPASAAPEKSGPSGSRPRFLSKGWSGRSASRARVISPNRLGSR